MNETKKTSQRTEFIALKDMEGNSGYQRPTSDEQVADIVKKFDEAKLCTLIVSKRDGKYHILDGGHRARALRTLGYTHALCVVLTGLTYEQEAEYFRKQGENRRPMRQGDYFFSGIEARNEQCLKINSIAKTNGFQIARGSSKDFYKLSSFHALFSIVNDYGYDVLDNTLCLIAGTWNGISKASQSETLLGVAEFIHRYGMVSFAERMQDKFAVVFYEYSEAVRGRGAVGSIANRKKFCKILVEHYNKGFSSNNKKRLKWEE